MKVYFLRHGIAADPLTWDGLDCHRPLTNEGRKRVDKVAKAISAFQLNLGSLLTSPSRRAKETAEIVASQLDVVDKLEVEPRLSPGLNLDNLVKVLKEHSSDAELMLVGHEPDFSDAISALIGGGRLTLKKAGLARVDVTIAGTITGELVWLIPPKVLLGSCGAD